MSRSSTAGLRDGAGHHVEQLRRDPLAKLLERRDDLDRRRGGRAPVADVADAEVAAPAGRLAVGVDHRVALATLDVEDVLARAAAVYPEGLDATGRRVDPLAEEDTGESDLAARSGPDANDDLVETLSPAFFDVDVATKRRGDRCGEVAAGEFLRALVDGEVTIGDIDRLVRHLCILTPSV